MTYIRRDEYGDPVMTLSDLSLDAQAEWDRNRAKNPPPITDVFRCDSCQGGFYEPTDRDRHTATCDGGWIGHLERAGK